MELESREQYYRYVDGRYSNGVDEYGNVIPGPGQPYIHCHSFIVVKHTPKGVWIEEFGRKRFILSTANKRFALPNKEEAMISFLARKRRQLTILKAQVSHVEQVIIIGTNFNETSKSPFASSLG